MTDARALLRELNHTHARLHTAKEDAFWTAKMGLAPDAAAARADYAEKEIALQRFLQDPQRLRAVRAARAAGGNGGGPLSADEQVGLAGWERTFASHAIESAEARALFEEAVALEAKLAGARGAMHLGYRDPEQGFVPASSVKLAAMLRAEPREALRKAAWEGLRSIEGCALENGFLELVRLRNRLGRLEGAADYYDWKVRRAEGMSKAEVFALLDELEARTREAAQRSLSALRARSEVAVTPWSVGFLTQGDVTRAQDPYFPFALAVERWARGFAALGIDYAGAKLVLDLVDRAGKHENGFMHGPEPAWREGSTRHRARIQFTANAVPGQVGSGYRATQTLFHEGGHAAHFANVDMPAPCFGQEFAPTSVAFAETQSMFLDSLLDDADWQARWARTRQGEPMPQALIEKGVADRQAFAAWQARAMLTVCYAERAIYELPEAELTPERVLDVLRATEQRLLFLAEGSPRPVLAVPHLLADESSAYYHGYVMAEMGVAQTRRHFLDRDGHLVDNPRIGPELREAYWRPGNSRRCSELIEALTGQPLGAGALADELVRSVEETLEEERAALGRLPSIPQAQGPSDLRAEVRIVHGAELVAELGAGGVDALGRDFAAWIDRLEAASK